MVAQHSSLFFPVYWFAFNNGNLSNGVGYHSLLFYEVVKWIIANIVNMPQLQDILAGVLFGIVFTTLATGVIGF